MPVIRRGMPIRRQGSISQCSVGPFYTTPHGTYFFTVQHGMNQHGGNRVVEANLDGFNWSPVGTYLTGIQDESVDWAVVALNDNIQIDATLPIVDVSTKFKSRAPTTEKFTGVGFSHQAHGPVLFESSTIVQADLNGRVEKSPTFRNQYQCLTDTEARRANDGDSGIPVYNRKCQLVGMEWAIEWDGPARRHIFYVQPILVLATSFVGQLYELDKLRNTADYQRCAPLIDHVGSNLELVNNNPELANKAEALVDSVIQRMS